MLSLRVSLVVLGSFFLSGRLALPQNPAKGLITHEIDENRPVPLPHNTHPLARAEFGRGPAPASLSMDRMLLVLNPGPDRQQALDLLLRAQLDPASSQYHKWLTPEQYGQRFGAADADVAKVTGRLRSHGFSVGALSNGRNIIEFSGTAGQVQETFHTAVHQFVVDGKSYWANAGDPQIPAALTPVVAGVATLHNFRKASQITGLKPNAIHVDSGIQPQFTASDGTHALAPADFATLYDMYLLSGQGQYSTAFGTTIAVVARANINMQDLQDFKNAFGTPDHLSPSCPEWPGSGPDPRR